MSRTIAVSTDVFATIWAARENGEDSEDAILRRMLGCKSVSNATQSTADANVAGGVFDTRNSVRFPQGFTIIRTYKHKEYKAVADNGTWHRIDTGDRFPTLNQLNASIANGNENVWNGNWKYRSDEGVLRSINELR